MVNLLTWQTTAAPGFEFSLIWEQDTWLSQLYIIETVRIELEIHFIYIWPVIRSIWLDLSYNLFTMALSFLKSPMKLSTIQSVLCEYMKQNVLYIFVCIAFFLQKFFLAEVCRAWAFYKVFSSLFLRNMVVYCTRTRLLLWRLLLFSSILPIPLCLKKKTSP